MKLCIYCHIFKKYFTQTLRTVTVAIIINTFIMIGMPFHKFTASFNSKAKRFIVKYFYSWAQQAIIMKFERTTIRDVEAESEAGSGSGGSGTFSVEAEAEARKIHHFRFHIGGKNGERKKLVLLSFVEERMEGA